MKKIMFTVFTLVYLATAFATLFAFLAQARLISSGLKEGEQIPYLGLLVSAVLVETIAGYIAIAKDLFGLKSSDKSEEVKEQKDTRIISLQNELEKQNSNLKNENEELRAEIGKLTSLRARILAALHQSYSANVEEILKFLEMSNDTNTRSEVISLIGILLQEGKIKRAEKPPRHYLLANDRSNRS